jgi:hypothetical protein
VVSGNENGLIVSSTGVSSLSLSGVNLDDLTEGKMYWEVVKTAVPDTYDPEAPPIEYLHFRLYKDSGKKWLLAQSGLIDAGYNFSSPISLDDSNYSDINGTVTLKGFIEDSDDENVITFSISATGIAGALRAAIHDGSGNSHVDAALDANGNILLTPMDGYSSTPFSVAVGENLEVTSFQCPQFYASIDTGAIPCLIGSVNTIESSISGWDAVTNEEEGVSGRHLETDDEFRERIKNSPRINARATKFSIEERLVQEVSGVTLAIVKQNITDDYDPPGDITGQKPHSIHVTVQCADKDLDAVAEKIWELKPAGIPVWKLPSGYPGRVKRAIIDASGISREIYFSRPDPKYIWMKVTILNPATEEEAKKLLPADWQKTLTDNILQLGGTYSLGQDVAAQRFYALALQLGIKQVDVKVAYSTNHLATEPLTEYSVNAISIALSEIAVFDPTHPERITIGFSQ